MTDTTTISIRDDQKDELEAMKTHERESYKAVLDRLLDADAQGNTDTEPMRVVPIEEVAGRSVPQQQVTLEATEYSKIADEVEGRLR